MIETVSDTLPFLKAVFTMPGWAIVYCSALVIFGVNALIRYYRFGPRFIFGEFLSVSAMVGTFLFHYQVLERPEIILVPIAMLVYVLYWELYANSHVYEAMVDEIEAEVDNPIEDFSIVLVIGVWLFMLPFLLTASRLITSYL